MLTRNFSMHSIFIFLHKTKLLVNLKGFKRVQGIEIPKEKSLPFFITCVEIDRTYRSSKPAQGIEIGTENRQWENKA